VNYLYNKGYRKIAFIGGTTNRDTRGADRRLGYERAMAKLKLNDTRVISFGTPPITMKQGGEALSKLIDVWPDVEAVICVSDLSAFGALTECQRRSITVPSRIAIAGFGDFEISSCCFPTLTTVGVNCHDIGFQAGKLLLRAIDGDRNGQPIAAETIITQYSVIVRESA